ncbi:ATP-binding cassette domain-containing protein [Eubacterium xylanophilum]|uniref:ATP-binding cassette domain-containing protein n=1 Tax=Eubacterium xylanophilum TaxID=39497 RepID=UPI00047DD3D1|nr:ABC transporter ATP-binding protein [Eubacterium xylanophilum]
MIEASNICYSMVSRHKSFEIKDLNISLSRGYVTCLVGHNGAGKTTIMSLLYGMKRQNSGEVRFNGEIISPENIEKYREKVAFVGGKWCVPHMTVEENITMLSMLYEDFSKEKYDECLRLFEAEHLSDKVFEEMSTGEKKKVELAFCIARNPEFMFLDEPYANIDPVVRKKMDDIIVSLARKNNVGVLVSTHLIDEINDMVDYVAIVENGMLVDYEDREEILEKYEASNLREAVKLALKNYK